LSLVQEQRSLIHIIKKRQANWIGHVLRHDFLLKTVLEEEFEGTWTRGKTKKEDAGLTRGTSRQEDQLPRAEEKS